MLRRAAGILRVVRPLRNWKQKAPPLVDDVVVVRCVVEPTTWMLVEEDGDGAIRVALREPERRVGAYVARSLTLVDARVLAVVEDDVRLLLTSVLLQVRGDLGAAWTLRRRSIAPRGRRSFGAPDDRRRHAEPLQHERDVVPKLAPERREHDADVPRAFGDVREAAHEVFLEVQLRRRRRPVQDAVDVEEEQLRRVERSLGVAHLGLVRRAEPRDARSQ
mmetsp:Transcript_9865/g.40113  ORF Transcript_9865/g.40113 Transcript_9865/m.40113 type:complete len:219 (+) Transcript_9865:194-850(+)